ncbi:Ig domain-containing protein [Halanaerobacter jeridensis]|uniref:Uncharacterized protein n=1 Tax=Halanaerobacter jeridensis TaxID=706427 RepID=A0A938XSL6_9FIRM|nr:Ig domain-containing protein [Halanaerobacter jeridensis]MBM7557069.1 hypothetical protein [Halanaerobacter jeridensis]
MKTNKTLITISLLLVLILAFTACSSNDSNDLKPEGEAGLQLSFNQQSGISTQAVDETIEEKTTITEVKITVYEKSDYDSNGTSAEVVESQTGNGSSLSDIGAIALYLPANQDYVIEAALSGEVTNGETTNPVIGIYHGILDSTGVLQDKNTKEITVDVSPAKAQQLDVEISNLAEQVGTTTDIASMDVELWVPTVGTVTKNITSGQTVSFSSQDQLDNSSDNLELRPTVAQVDIQLKDSQGNDIVKAGEFGGEVLFLPKQSQSLTVDQQPYLELDKASVSVDESGGAEDTLTFSLTAADPDGDEVTLGIDDTTKPSGASFDASAGEFTWSPGTDQQGTYEVVFTAESSGGSTQEMVTITVNDKLDIDVNQITSPNAPTLKNASYDGSAVSLTVDSATGNADYLVYRNTSNDPSGAEPVSDGLVDVTTWSDSSVEGGNTYYYWVKRYSADGLSSELSNSLGETVPAGSVSEMSIDTSSVEEELGQYNLKISAAFNDGDSIDIVDSTAGIDETIEFVFFDSIGVWGIDVKFHSSSGDQGEEIKRIIENQLTDHDARFASSSNDDIIIDEKSPASGTDIEMTTDTISGGINFYKSIPSVKAQLGEYSFSVETPFVPGEKLVLEFVGDYGYNNETIVFDDSGADDFAIYAVTNDDVSSQVAEIVNILNNYSAIGLNHYEAIDNDPVIIINEDTDADGKNVDINFTVQPITSD